MKEKSTTHHSTQVWTKCLDIIRNRVSPQSFNTWFKPIKPVELHGDTLIIQVPNKFFYEWLEEHYIDVLRQAIHQTIGPHGKLEYRIVVDNYKRVDLAEVHSPSGDASQVDFLPEEIKNPFIIPGIKHDRILSHLKQRYTFDNFIVGDSNRFAYNAAKAVANRPGKTAFNPLFIFGKVGLGKTHLAQAIGNAITHSHPKLNVVYITTERLTHQVIYSIRHQSMDDLMRYYQNVHILIVDDIQFLARRPKTQEIFFHIFNHMHQLERQIILTSDRPVKELEHMEERLVSRFKWGVTVDLQPPDFELKLAIARARLREEQVHVPERVLEYLCYHAGDSIRDLEGILSTLVARALFLQGDITMSTAQKILQYYKIQREEVITVESIARLVCDHFNIPLQDVKGKTRKRPIVEARQLIMYLSKKFTKHSLKQIGKFLGNRDHTTVIYACRTVEDLIETDEKYRQNVFTIEKKLRLSYSL